MNLNKPLPFSFRANPKFLWLSLMFLWVLDEVLSKICNLLKNLLKLKIKQKYIFLSLSNLLHYFFSVTKHSSPVLFWNLTFIADIQMTSLWCVSGVPFDVNQTLNLIITRPVTAMNDHTLVPTLGVTGH